MKRNLIIQGDALAGLRTLPDESVDMCMTSPPYWALRDYGTEPLIWDGNPQCNHQWKTTNATMHSGRGDAQKGALYRDQEPIPDMRISHGSCIKCGAWKGSLGLEPTPEMFIKHLCDIFDEVHRALKPEGTCWVNLGDCYGGQFGEPNAPKLSEGRKGQYASAAFVKERLPAKSLVQIPARFQIEMSNRGWLVRNEIIWFKPNCMPSSAKDRFTIDFEKLFFFTKSRRHYFKQQFEPFSDAYLKRCEAVRRNNEVYDPARHKTDKRGMAQSGMEILVRTAKKGANFRGRNKRTVWPINPRPFRDAHFATYPEALCWTPIDAGCPLGGVVMDPFFGSGTTGLVALKQDKDFVGIELNPDYIKMAVRRLDPFMPVILAE